MDIDNKYTIMQKKYYESTAHLMAETNHIAHNSNPNLWFILFKDCVNFDSNNNKTAFEFGCGCGRNIANLLRMNFKQADGCDISLKNIKNAKKYLIDEFNDIDKSKLYVTNGVELNGVESNKYDYVISTIVLQHISVYEIRYNILKELYRIMRKDGIFSFQMGFDYHPHDIYKIEYKENNYDAEGTNGYCDVIVTDPNQIIDDLKEIGFKNISCLISEPFCDNHHKWIYVRCAK